MSYLFLDIDVRDPLPSLALHGDESGVAVLVRRGGAPVAFRLLPATRRRVVDPGALRALVADVAATATRLPPPRPARLPSVTAAVCTHDRPELLARSLASLRRLARAVSGLRLELLVVDNAPSDDRTRAVVATHADVRYVCEPRTGLDFARNRAWQEASGDFVAYFDDDVVADPGWTAGFAEAWAEHPDASAITGPVLAYELATPAQIMFERFGGFGHRFTKARFDASRPGDPTYPCAPGMLGTGCNMALRRDVLRRLGGFDEALDTGRPLPGGGDLDILYRIVRGAPPVVVEPRCLVFHEHRREHAALRHQMWTWGLGTMAFLTKTYRTDRPTRSRVRKRIRAWFACRVREAAAWTVGRSALPLGTIVAMTAGGVVGLLGEYDRSRRRVERIRRDAEVAAVLSPRRVSAEARHGA